jgi:integrase
MIYYNYNLRNKSSKKETPIHLIVRFNREKIVINTGEKVKPELWDNNPKSKRYHRVKKDYKFNTDVSINDRLNEILVLVKKVVREYLSNNSNDIDKYELHDILKAAIRPDLIKHNKPKSLTLFIEDFIQLSMSRINPQTGLLISGTTIKKYRTTLNYLLEYSSLAKLPFDFNKIDIKFYNGFVSFLAKQKNIGTNTIGKHITNLKLFLDTATMQGLNQDLTYRTKQFKKPSEDVDHIYLTPDEIEEIRTLDLAQSSKLSRVKDTFLIGCYTGLRFADISKLSETNIMKRTFDNKEFKVLEVYTQKTGKKVEIPINEKLNALFEKYLEETGNILPPMISNQKFNKYIKEICSKCPSLQEIIQLKRTVGGKRKILTYNKHELVSSHTARRSCATNLFKSGCPSISIMRITGHSSEKMLLKYIKITPEQNALMVKDHFDVL